MPPSMAQEEKYPAEWQDAFARERCGIPLPADPRPERLAGRVLAAFIVTGLVFLALPGTLLGVLNLLSISGHQSPTAAHTAWIQAHGQAQLFGWVGTFILGISLYVLPKIQGRGLKTFEEPWAIWALWTAGVGLHWWAGFGSWHWQAMLVTAAILELAGYGLAMHILIFTPGHRERRAPRDLSSWMGMVGFGPLGVALLLNLGASLHLVRNAVFPIVPPSLDRSLVLIAVWGFVVPVAWGYSARFVTILLGLEPPDHGWAKWLSAGVLLLVVLALIRQFLLADLLAVILTMAGIRALRVFHPARRLPKLLGAHRHYPFFVRLAFVWLLVGAFLGPCADLFPSLSGLGGASRHAVTVGFIATLVFTIGQRMLPSFLNGRELYSLGLMGASLWVLNLGCLLRVSTESVAYSAGGFAWKMLPFSAFLELAAVLMFVANLGLSLVRPMLVWFGPEGVKPTLTLYWCISSFPATRRILIDSGLITLARVHEVPRTLTLAEAAQADGAPLHEIIQDLRVFFSRHQPRRSSQVLEK
jgi:NnrS protein